jgi:Icc-related predicted phosphoesterase
MPLAVLGLSLALVAQPAGIAPASAPAKPATWAELETRYLLECRAPFHLEVEPVARELPKGSFRLEGSRVVRVGARPKRVVIGMLSALKDVEPATRVNVKRAMAAFDRAKVDLIIANGDVALNEFDLEEAMDLLGATGFPTFVSIGNSEGRGAFNRAFVAAEARHSNLFNMNWVRHVDLGLVDLVSLPGYYNRPFIHKTSGCHYDAADIEAVGLYVDELKTTGRTPVLVAHGPPKSRGAGAIDRATEFGNVGDPGMQQLILDRDVRFGLFGHILEAGGRAASDVRLGTAAKPKRRHRRLYVNAGAASSMPLAMLGGKTSRGLAMIVTFDRKGARYEVLKLRK